MRRLRRSHLRDAVLDDDTADRLVCGQLGPDDAPPEYRTVASLVEALGGPATEHERSGASDAVASILGRLTPEAVQTALTPRRTPMRKRRIAQLAVASSVGVMTLVGGLAAANALPGVAQGVASDVLGVVGVDVPSPNGNAGTQPGVRGQSDAHPAPPSDEAPSAGVDTSSRSDGLETAAGNVTNDVASGVLDTLTTSTPGPELGAEVSDSASEGAARVPTSTPPVSLPDQSGAGLQHKP